MALTLQALGLEAKDQGVSESAWIVQIAGTIIFQKKIHSWKTPIMRSVAPADIMLLLGIKNLFQNNKHFLSTHLNLVAPNKYFRDT